MTENKISKRGFIKLFLSTIAFLSLGGLSFILPKTDLKKQSGYGQGGYGQN